jgi:hypothetical protein
MKDEVKELNSDFLFEGTGVEDQTLSVFDKKSSNLDGIYRAKYEDGKDKKTYKSKFRFLPNLGKDGKVGAIAIERHQHFVDFPNEPTLGGYYDCAKNFEPKCDICTMYWKLHNSKNAAEVEKAETIKRSTKYYSYILVLEDEQHPELVGKIMIFPYGWTIKEKILAEKNGEISEPCNVFDLVKGKDFVFIIKEKAGFQNYDSSGFDKELSPIKLYDEGKKRFVVAPVDAEGKISDAKVKNKVKDFLLNRTVELNDHLPVRWDEEIAGKVQNVLAILTGSDYEVAKTTASNGGEKTGKQKPTDEDFEESGATTADDFFSFEESDEEGDK